MHTRLRLIDPRKPHSSLPNRAPSAITGWRGFLSLAGFTLHFMPARDTATVADLTLLVRTPSHLNGYKAFTEQQADEAAQYAHSQGVEVERLP